MVVAIHHKPRHQPTPKADILPTWPLVEKTGNTVRSVDNHHRDENRTNPLRIVQLGNPRSSLQRYNQ